LLRVIVDVVDDDRIAIARRCCARAELRNQMVGVEKMRDLARRDDRCRSSVKQNPAQTNLRKGRKRNCDADRVLPRIWSGARCS
jgi:hypothetical protein